MLTRALPTLEMESDWRFHICLDWHAVDRLGAVRPLPGGGHGCTIKFAIATALKDFDVFGQVVWPYFNNQPNRAFVMVGHREPGIYGCRNFRNHGWVDDCWHVFDGRTTH